MSIRYQFALRTCLKRDAEDVVRGLASVQDPFGDLTAVNHIAQECLLPWVS